MSFEPEWKKFELINDDTMRYFNTMFNSKKTCKSDTKLATQLNKLIDDIWNTSTQPPAYQS